MAETLYISKENKDTYTTDEVLLCFNNSDNLEEIKAYVEKAEDRLFVSWASVDGTDKDGEKIPIGLVIKAQDKLMERKAPIMYRHTNKNIGRTLNYKVYQHPKTGRMGVLHLNLIYDDLPIDNEVWENIKNGKLKGLSVGGQGVIGSKEYNDDLNSMVEVYSQFGQYETSIVENPSNPLALTEAVSVAKEDKMAEDKKEIQDVVKELSEVVSSLKTDVETLNSKFDEIKKEESEPVKEVETKVEEEAVEEKSEEAVETEKESDSITIETLASQVSDLSSKVESLTKESKKEDTEDKEDEEKPVKKEAEVEEVVKEETIEMEAPAVNVEKQEEKKDVMKEYNEDMSKFQKGELTYEQVLNKYKRGNQ